MFGAGGCDFFQILGARVALFSLFGNGDRDISAVFDYVPNGFQARFKSGNTDGRGPHIHTTPRLSQIQGNAQNSDLLRDNTFGKIWFIDRFALGWHCNWRCCFRCHKSRSMDKYA